LYENVTCDEAPASLDDAESVAFEASWVDARASSPDAASVTPGDVDESPPHAIPRQIAADDERSAKSGTKRTRMSPRDARLPPTKSQR
jgi:hypothetical protein